MSPQGSLEAKVKCRHCGVELTPEELQDVDGWIGDGWEPISPYLVCDGCAIDLWEEKQRRREQEWLEDDRNWED